MDTKASKISKKDGTNLGEETNNEKTSDTNLNETLGSKIKMNCSKTNEDFMKTNENCLPKEKLSYLEVLPNELFEILYKVCTTNT